MHKSVFTKVERQASYQAAPQNWISAYPTISSGTAWNIEAATSSEPRKASGLDEIPVRMLHELSVEIAPAITVFFLMSIDGREVLSQWKKAWITPVFKKGDVRKRLTTAPSP